MKYCPWCGQLLELKIVDLGSKFKHVCLKCGWKIREVLKPELKTGPELKEEERELIEVKKEEEKEEKEKILGAIPRPVWPIILGAGILVAVIIILIKIFLV